MEEFGREGADCVSSPVRVQVEGPKTRAATQELVDNVAWGSTAAQDAAMRLRANLPAEVGGAGDESGVMSDAVWVASVEASVQGEGSLVAGRLAHLVHALVGTGVCDPVAFCERLGADILEKAGLLSSEDGLARRQIRVNTKFAYTQHKFNLVREESEGFARLVVELTGLPESSERAGASARCPSLEMIAQAILGHFRVDPNRVVQIVFGCWERDPSNSAFPRLVRALGTNKLRLAQHLGVRFQHAINNVGSPTRLYRLAAELLSCGEVLFSSLRPHLSPSDQGAQKTYVESIMRQLAHCRTVGAINLTAGAGTEEGSAAGSSVAASGDPTAQALTDFSTAIYLGDLGSGENQLLGITHGLLSVGNWAVARILLERYRNIDPAAQHPGIALYLRRMLTFEIDGTYTRLHLNPMGKVVASYASLGGSDRLSKDHEIDLTHIFSADGKVCELISHLGPLLGDDAVLLTKLFRLLRLLFSLHDMSRDGDKPFFDAGDRVIALLAKNILPAISLCDASVGLAQEAWLCIRELPYETRFYCYGEWGDDAIQRWPRLAHAKAVSSYAIKRVMRRLAKENTLQFGRVVGRLSHSNPLATMQICVEQAVAYKQMHEPLVQSMRFLTPLAFDVLTFVILKILNGEKSKLKEDGMNLADWFQNLAVFVGILCRRWHAHIGLVPLLQSVACALKADRSLDLLLLKELLSKMASLEALEGGSDAQIDAAAGGETLRAEAASFLQVTNVKQTKSASACLRDALLVRQRSQKTPLAFTLLALIAQQRNSCVFNTAGVGKNIKLIGELYDRVQECLIQYTEFLSLQFVDVSSYQGIVRSLSELVDVHKMEPEVAFHAFRPIMNKVNRRHRASDDQNADKGALQNTLPSWESLRETARRMLPVKAWQSLSAEFYLTFWSLTLYDVHIPRSQYAAEIARQEAEAKQMENFVGGVDGLPESRRQAEQRERAKGRCIEVGARLKDELVAQEHNFATVRMRLESEKDSWFTGADIVDNRRTTAQYVQHCIFPRVLFSVSDAVFCARFTESMHAMGTPYFSTLQYLDTCFLRLPQLVHCCTEEESKRIGRFLCETLRLVNEWRSEAVYDKFCKPMPGFAENFGDTKKVDFVGFCKCYAHWQRKLLNTFKECLQVSEPQEVRNGLIVLSSISSQWPNEKKCLIHMEELADTIKNSDSEGLKTLALGYFSKLQVKKAALGINTSHSTPLQGRHTRKESGDNIITTDNKDESAGIPSQTFRSRESDSTRMRHVPGSSRLHRTAEGDRDDSHAPPERGKGQGREDTGTRDSPRTAPSAPVPQSGNKRRRAGDELHGSMDNYARDIDRDGGKRARGNYGPHPHISSGGWDDRRQDIDRPREEDRRREAERRREEDRRRQEDRWREEDRRRQEDRRREEGMLRDRRDGRGVRGRGRR